MKSFIEWAKEKGYITEDYTAEMERVERRTGQREKKYEPVSGLKKGGITARGFGKPARGFRKQRYSKAN